MMGAFIVGFIVGAVVFWFVSKYIEQYRRAVRDFRKIKRDIRLLFTIMVRRGVSATLWFGVGAVAVIVVIGILMGGGK